MYSDNKTVNIKLKEVNKKLTVQISNSGQTITEKDQQKLFQPFMRGENAKNKRGIGLGLKMVQRILSIYKFKIYYSSSNNLNLFTIEF